MAGPIIALEIIIIFIYAIIALALLVLTVIKRKKLNVSIPLGFVFVCMAWFAISIYVNTKKNHSVASKNFLGDYKLLILDRKECDSCRVRLYEDYHYDIFAKNKLVGQGNWNIETAVDIPGYFLKLENGPTYVVREKDRLIDEIDRTENR